MEVPLALLQQQHQKESGFPAGGAQGGWRRSFYFQIHQQQDWNLKHSAFLVRQLGRLVRNLWHAAHSRMTKVAHFVEVGWESESGPVNSSLHDILWFLLVLSLVLDEESVDSKVLYKRNISNSEIQPLIAVKRDNFQHWSKRSRSFLGVRINCNNHL